MRKLAVAGLAVLGVFAVAGIALAANTYTSTSGVNPAKTGKPAKPTPVSASLTFHVGESTGARPSPLKTYSIGLGPGVVPNTRVARGCTSSQANAQVLPAICAKAASRGGAKVGGGSVQALAGPTNNTASKLNCYLAVTLVNSTVRNHMWIRIDGVTTGPPGRTCVTAQHSSIDSTFVRTGSAAAAGTGASAAAARLPIYAIKFSVPASLLHPIPGFDVAVVDNVSNVSKVSKRIGRVTHGYLETIGCPKTPRGKRLAIVTFTAENGQVVTAQSSSRCTK
jgi:hypothetical protein